MEVEKEKIIVFLAPFVVNEYYYYTENRYKGYRLEVIARTSKGYSEEIDPILTEMMNALTYSILQYNGIMTFFFSSYSLSKITSDAKTVLNKILPKYGVEILSIDAWSIELLSQEDLPENYPVIVEYAFNDILENESITNKIENKENIVNLINKIVEKSEIIEVESARFMKKFYRIHKDTLDVVFKEAGVVKRIREYGGNPIIRLTPFLFLYARENDEYYDIHSKALVDQYLLMNYEEFSELFKKTLMVL